MPGCSQPDYLCTAKALVRVESTSIFNLTHTLKGQDGIKLNGRTCTLILWLLCKIAPLPSHTLTQWNSIRLIGRTCILIPWLLCKVYMLRNLKKKKKKFFYWNPSAFSFLTSMQKELHQNVQHWNSESWFDIYIYYIQDPDHFRWVCVSALLSHKKSPAGAVSSEGVLESV